MEQVERARSLPSVTSVIRYHIVLILATTFLALAFGGLYVANMPSSYTATAVLLLSPAPGNPLTAETASSSSAQMTVALETERQLVRTPAVFDLVMNELGREIPDSAETLEVSVPSNTQMLKLSFTSATPERASEGAQAFADGYLRYRAQRAESVQDAKIKRLKGQIAETDGNLRRAVAESGNSAYATQEVVLFVDRLSSLKNSLSTTELVSTYPGSVTSSPTVPESTNSLPGWLLLLVAAALGLMVGVGLAIWRELRRDIIRDADIGTELGVPVFATIRPRMDDRLATSGSPEVHESYRRLRTAVIANAPRPYTLAVTAVGNDSVEEGLSLSAEVAANLAVVLAEAKLTVLLIATNSMQHPVEQLLGFTPHAGLTDVVLKGASASDSLVLTHGVSVLTAGRQVEGSSDLTATSAFRSVVEDLRQHYDYTILAASPAGSSDGDSVLLVSDSALLVLTPNTTTRTLLSIVLDRLQHLAVETLGAASVRRSRERGRGRPDRGSNEQLEVRAARAVDGTEAELACVSY